MPIVIEVPVSGTVGPGQLIRFTSDFIGPLPTNTSWRIKIGTEADTTNPFLTILKPAGGIPIGTTQVLIFDQGEVVSTLPLSQPIGGATVHVNAELVTDTGVIDSGTRTAVWDATTGLGQQVFQLQSTGGGLTTGEHELLVATERRSQVLGEPTDLTINTPSGLVTSTLARLFSRSFVDQLVLSEVTAGETCDPVRFSYSEWYAGIAIRVTTIDPALSPKTPDQNWYFPDLAVLRIFRGADLKFRRGIHTPTFITDEPYEWGWNIRNFLEFLGAPPATEVAVDWRPGCCGRVFLVRIP